MDNFNQRRSALLHGITHCLMAQRRMAPLRAARRDITQRKILKVKVNVD